MKSSAFILFILGVSSTFTWSQNQLTNDTPLLRGVRGGFLKEIQKEANTDSLCFDKKIIDYSIDVNGAIFLSFKGGTITKYSSTLDSLFTYSPIKVGDTKLLESGSGLFIFAFYDFFQEYILTDRFLSRPTRTSLSNSAIDYVDLATQSLDNNLWLVENSGFRLIKFNTNLNIIEFEIALNTIIDSPDNNFTFIKEYQNQVFLVDENSGIYVFDNLGNFSKFIPAATTKCTFENNNIIYLEKGEKVIADIYSTQEERITIAKKEIVGIITYKNNTYYIHSTCLFRTY